MEVKANYYGSPDQTYQKASFKGCLAISERLFEPLEDQQKDRHTPTQHCGKFAFVQNELPLRNSRGTER